MSDAFTAMIRNAIAFFRELEPNNTKAWFDANRERYKSDIKAPAEQFVSLMAEELSQLTGDTIRGKLFRANRDVRFSKDKTPYHCHLHMSWSGPELKGATPGFFFGAAPAYITAGYGVMGFQGDSLTAWRAMIDSHGDDFQAVVDGIGAEISDYGPDPLKRVPAPYAPDHPHGELLRRKSFALHHDLIPALKPKSAQAFDIVRDAFSTYRPLHDFFGSRF